MRRKTARAKRKTKPARSRMTAREKAVLERAVGELAARENRQYVTPAEFERYLAATGVRISHKNLYKTYLGPGARYAGAMPRNAEGRIHRERGAEIIRLVQARETPDAMNALAMRATAEARLKTAQAERAEILLAELRGRKLDVAIVTRVWTRAIENFKSELRGLSMALPDDLTGKAAAEMKQILDGRFHDALRHLAVEIR